MVTIVWNDGHADTGRNYADAMAQARRGQWSRYTRRGFRRELAARVLIWNGATVPTHGTNAEFLRRLEAAGIIRLEVGHE